MSPLLDAIRVLEVGGRAAAVCGRLFAQLGADVLAVRSESAERAGAAEQVVLDANKRTLSLDLTTEPGRTSLERLVAGADLVLLDMPARGLEALGLDPHRIVEANPRLVVVAITSFGLTGPRRDYLGGDLVAFHSSGIARMLTGLVDDPDAEPGIRAAGEQSDFVVGLGAACAAIDALYRQQRTGLGQLVDISEQEALALMYPVELAKPAFGMPPAARGGFIKGINPANAVLPTTDGYLSVSPLEEVHWQRWLHILGDPAWGAEPRFATRESRLQHWAELYEVIAAWTRPQSAEDISIVCQEQHVAAFPFSTPARMLDEPQLRHRGSFVPLERPGAAPVLVSRPPFGLPASDYAAPVPSRPAGDWLPRAAAPAPASAAAQPALPLEGVHVLDFTWVVAGPSATRYLSLMGAEVIKVEAPGRPDSSRASLLHDVAGQSKLGLSIDLKAEGALDAVRRLLTHTDIVIDNFATGVMERLGLGYEDLRAVRPDIIQISSSGLGRSGPRGDWVAYGTLLSSYVGFMDDPPEREPRTGGYWADSFCGLMLAFAAGAALHARERTGAGRYLDFSMIEALLWAMPARLLAAQVEGVTLRRSGNVDPEHVPHDVYHCRGEERWLAIAVTDDAQWLALCGVVPALEGMAALSEAERRQQRATIDAHLAVWARDRDAFEAMNLLQAVGVPASASYNTADLFEDEHLRMRGMYRTITEPDGTERVLPGLPWRWGDDSLLAPRAAPAQGEHSEHVLTRTAGLSETELDGLRRAGAFGALAPTAG